LKATLSLHQQVIHEETACLDLNNELSGKERLLDFCIPAHKLQKGVDAYMLEVKSESQVLFSAKVSLGIPDIFTLNGVRFKMIKVEGGTFKMGSPKNDSDSYDNEKPQHDVTLKEFYIGETVVTQALWKAVMKGNPPFFSGKDELPVENVSYYDITGFLAQLNDKLKDQLHGKKFALPTEEQWEFAARGGVKSKGYKYSGSNDITQVAWYDNNSSSRTHPVRKKAPNELGIYDMSGNVWEWCDSYWRNNYNANQNRSNRIIRGGCWGNVARTSRVAYRSYGAPGNRFNSVGFRLVLQ
jgi:formylglycine-generating enzyme required for sulfatase activity